MRPIRFPGRRLRPGRAAEDLCQAHQPVEAAAPLCANPPACSTSSRSDERLEGAGNWGRARGRARLWPHPLRRAAAVRCLRDAARAGAPARPAR